MTRKQIIYATAIVYFIVAAALVWLCHKFFVKGQYLAINALFLLVPGMFTALKNDIDIGKNTLIAFITTFFSMIVLDPLAINDLAWHVEHSIFETKFLGIAPYEDFLGAFSVQFLTISLFQSFYPSIKAEIIKMSWLKIFKIMMPWLFVFSAADQKDGGPIFSSDIVKFIAEY